MDLEIHKFCQLPLLWISKTSHRVCNYPAGIYLLKVNNKNTRTRFEICSKLTMKTPERRHWQLTIGFQPVYTCSKLTIETLEKRCEISLKLTIKTPERRYWRLTIGSQPEFTCLKLTTETLEKGVKYVQS